MHRFVLRSLGLLCALALAGRVAWAETPGAELTLGSNHDLAFTGLAEGGNYTLEYDPTCSNDATFAGKPCYVVTAGQGMVGVPIAATGCTAKMGNGYTPSAAKCPATGVAGVTIFLKHGGTITIPDVKGHPGTACSPAPVTVKTGSGANVVTLNDGCHESVNCSLTGHTGFVGGDVDAVDSIKGGCTNLIKH